jgi:hypothetical protein
MFITFFLMGLIQATPNQNIAPVRSVPVTFTVTKEWSIQKSDGTLTTESQVVCNKSVDFGVYSENIHVNSPNVFCETNLREDDLSVKFIASIQLGGSMNVRDGGELDFYPQAAVFLDGSSSSSLVFMNRLIGNFQKITTPLIQQKDGRHLFERLLITANLSN